VLEGTYPFVAGGVSSWVHHLVTHMDDLTFAVLHVSPSKGFYGHKMAYDMPNNVLWLEEIYLHAPFTWRGLFQRRPPASLLHTFSRFIQELRVGDLSGFDDLVEELQTQEGRTKTGDLLLDKTNWATMVDELREGAPEESFLNYFWTWYYAHQPLVNVLTCPLPEARVYHTVSTGYAGALAAAASSYWERPMILTEHGIYTRERRIEIYAADWINDRPGDETIASEAPYFRRFWNRQFQMMSRICYEHASEIFTLYTDNTEEQIRDGASPDKIRVIPNGIDVNRFDLVFDERQARPPNERFTIGFIGRVCPIKDVRTFISAMRLVVEHLPDARIRVLGPWDEDPEYAEECMRFARALELDDNLVFEGRVAVDRALPALDLVVLTSISEAQPLVILEAGAAGIPLVTTEVGCCRELLEGRTPEDRSLGPGGLITPIASPGETARAVLLLAGDPQLRRQMGANLRARVKRYYDQGDMVHAYRMVYESHIVLEELPWQESASSSAS